MYADETTGLMFPYFQNLSSSDVQQFDDFCHSHKSITTCLLDSLIQTPTTSTNTYVSDYDLGGEGDLFKAPEPIIEQPLISPAMTCAMSMISNCGEDAISPNQLKVTDIESLQNEEFLNDVFYDCKDILAKEVATGTESWPYSQVLNLNLTDENSVVTEHVLPPSYQIPKSMSSDCLTSMDWIQGTQVKPSYLNLSEIDFGGMRRAFSEGDIKTLAHDANTSLNHHHHHPGQPSPLLSERSTEDRLQKLSRYRNKKTKRNFGRKIKYACRKALADSQPRIRGRFAKTETNLTF